MSKKQITTVGQTKQFPAYPTAIQTLPTSTSTSSHISSSLPLQIFLFLNIYYYPLVWIVTLGLLIYKGYVFQYATSAFPLEVFALFPWAGIEVSRIFLGYKGNKTEDMPPVIIFICLTIVACIAHLFYMLWQSYVLFFDVILNSIGLVFIVGELITSGILISNLARNKQ
ncbi:hypothetical protein QVD99_003075 [Batrachochytrium dendrobatidis]|nr:hypothetical protein QVD99_003075 [Batrachochytrium dendrobatidis]